MLMCDFILFWYDIEIAYSPQNSTVTLSLISCQNLSHLTGVNILIAMLRHGYSLSSVDAILETNISSLTLS